MTAIDTALADVNASIDVSSAAFADEGQIPAQYSSDGEGLSPPLEWSGVPRQRAKKAPDEVRRASAPRVCG